jgi:hypothetical protein
LKISKNSDPHYCSPRALSAGFAGLAGVRASALALAPGASQVELLLAGESSWHAGKFQTAGSATHAKLKTDSFLAE